MSSPFVGEIRMFAGNFAPAGWMFCDGQLLPISENETLFQLIGTTYGGDGQSTFALPNLQSRIPIHPGTGTDGITRQLAEQGGVEQVTLTTNQIPAHSHQLIGTTAAGAGNSPQDALIGESPTVDIFSQAAAPSGNIAATAITPVGGSQPHENMMPFLCINYIISLFGVFPTQN